ncbi:MAG: glycoside hydrolase family 3 protein [Hyphomicrobiaceae bacterium]|nr:glycoside hydrolase family 3 protein [Hyphomicrobiaceae bacterium]
MTAAPRIDPGLPVRPRRLAARHCALVLLAGILTATPGIPGGSIPQSQITAFGAASAAARAKPKHVKQHTKRATRRALSARTPAQRRAAAYRAAGKRGKAAGKSKAVATAASRLRALELSRRRTIIARRAPPQQRSITSARLAPDRAPLPTQDTNPSPAATASPGTPLGPKAPRPTLAMMRSAVLAAPNETLLRLGRHLIVGYHNARQLTPLLERGALGGVFVTARNARGRNKAALAKEIASFRALATAAGQDTFWIATDQEGGGVSRLSPPLPRQISLPSLLRKLKTPEEREAAVKTYAAKQGAALAEIGVNLNFSPVADLHLEGALIRDRYTRLRYRAISADPDVVTAAVRTYCAVLSAEHVNCTLKHFPGLGRVKVDTHVASAFLKTPLAELEAKDWVPFKSVLADTPAMLMIGHPHLTQADPANPASTSRAVISGLVREAWKFNGVIVTDDMAMGAIKRRPGGVATASVDALRAGADLILISTDGDGIFAVLYELMLAEAAGTLDRATLGASARRLRANIKATELARTNSSQQPVPADPAAAGKIGARKIGVEKSGAVDQQPTQNSIQKSVQKSVKRESTALSQ